MDVEELELFRGSLRHATSSHSGEALDDALDELGWREAFDDDRRAAVSVLFELQGAAATTSSALSEVMGAALGLPAGTGVVLPVVGTEPPGELAADGLRVSGLGVGALARCDVAVVVAGDVAACVDVQDLTLRPVHGLDPELGLVEVTVDGVLATTQPAPWSAAVAAGQVAVAQELVGVARTMLQLARDHAVERIQFGQPIGSFQAVRHRLAESHVAIEAAAAACDAAWDVESPLTAALAKAIAGRSARTVARHAQQVLAGIGFTTEHPLHRYVRRAYVLDALLGDARSLTLRLGQDLLAARQLPPRLPL